MPSHKLLRLAYQMASRLAPKQGAQADFQAVLQDTLVRMALQHPYHVIQPLAALRDGVATTPGGKGKSEAARAVIEVSFQVIRAAARM